MEEENKAAESFEVEATLQFQEVAADNSHSAESIGSESHFESAEESGAADLVEDKPVEEEAELEPDTQTPALESADIKEETSTDIPLPEEAEVTNAETGSEDKELAPNTTEAESVIDDHSHHEESIAENKNVSESVEEPAISEADSIEPKQSHGEESLDIQADAAQEDVEPKSSRSSVSLGSSIASDVSQSTIAKAEKPEAFNQNTSLEAGAEDNSPVPALPPRHENPFNVNAVESSSQNAVDSSSQNELDNQVINLDDSTEVAPVVEAKPVKKWFKFNLKSAANSTDSFSEQMQNLLSPQNYSLAFTKFRENVEDLRSKSPKDQELINTGANRIRQTFNEIKTGIEFTNDHDLIKGIDWEFWSQVINDYSSVVSSRSDDLIKHITDGIPRELRGMVWQVICNSKSPELEELFRELKKHDSDYEKLIKRDLARTSFVTNTAVKSKIEDLFEIIKAYSLYDKDVGYTQGMAFITVPLLMNMDASEAFCMLVKLMRNYDFKELFLPSMPGLHLKLYQFDRLLEEMLPDLFEHLKKQGVKSSMYATQWFLTLFGYKFPLEMVLRVFDIVIAEGLESVLKFAVNLMEKNQEHLLTLTFDDLLPFLKEKLFFYYVDNASNSETVGGISRNLKDGYSNREITMDTYKLEEFVTDSMSIKILPATLLRYSAEYEEIHKLEGELEAEIDELKTKNGHLIREIRNIEAAYATLNREHVEIANEMVQGKVQIANLQDENRHLHTQIEELKKRSDLLEKQSDTEVDFSGEISTNMEMEIKKTMERNLEVMEENRLLEEQLSSLEKEYNEVKKEVSEMKLSGKWLKKGVFW